MAERGSRFCGRRAQMRPRAIPSRQRAAQVASMRRRSNAARPRRTRFPTTCRVALPRAYSHVTRPKGRPRNPPFSHAARRKARPRLISPPRLPQVPQAPPQTPQALPQNPPWSDKRRHLLLRTRRQFACDAPPNFRWRLSLRALSEVTLSSFDRRPAHGRRHRTRAQHSTPQKNRVPRTGACAKRCSQ